MSQDLELFSQDDGLSTFDQIRHFDEIPYTNRQDIRCYYLHEKNKVILDTKYGEEELSE